MKKFYLFVFAFAGLSAGRLFGQTASITSPSSSVSIASGTSVTFSGSKGGSFNGSGNYTYSWSASPSTGVSFSPASQSTNSSSSSTTATFNTGGTYSVSLTISRGSSSVVSSAVQVGVNPGSTVSASANSASMTLPTDTTTLKSVFTANGNTISGYAWTESSSDVMTGTINAPSSASTSVGFTSPGTYNFTVTATYAYQNGSGTGTASANVSVTVNSASVSAYPSNLFALSASGTEFSGFAIGNTAAQSGTIIDGMNSIAGITATSTSAALGEDANGYFYFLPNVQNTGNVTIYAMNGNGTGQTAIATADINGSSNSDLGFVRLGIDASGTGWILASNNNDELYLATFPANGLNATSITVVNSNVGVQGGGTASTFGSGDLAFDKNGVMYALANDANNDTYIYTMIPSLNEAYVTLKWTLVDPNGAKFTGSVNGCAFDSAGSMYISTSNGLYFIDQNTINTAGTGTVKTRLAYNGTGFTDLATNIFPPKTTLPVILSSFTATKQGTNALVQWTTEREMNSDYTEVQRSSDGLTFTDLGSVAASGTTNVSHNYQYTDPVAGLSGVLYYRLKEVDLDGSYTYSSVVALRLDGSSLTSSFSVYPNPFTSSVKIVVNSQSAANAEIRIDNISGQEMMSQQTVLQQGQNIIVFDNLSLLPPGIYLVQMVSGSKTVTQKIIKQ